MIPLRDNIRARRVPIVNYSLIVATTLVFLCQVQQGLDDATLIERFGMVPQRVLDPESPVVVTSAHPVFGRVESELASAVVSPWLTLLTCIFLHGGWLHFLGNMWFLHIFGDNVEDRLGRVGYLVFYLASGVAASGAHLASVPGSPVPTIGASGAIAGVMGAYLLLYPRAMVLAAIPIVVVLQVLVVPAWFFLVFWFVLQLFQGAVMSAGTTGVAWWAHIGGFVVGAAVILGLRYAGVLKSREVIVLPRTQRAANYGRYRFRPRRRY